MVITGVGVAVGVVIVGPGAADDPDDQPEAASGELAPRLRDVDTTNMAISRASFCERIPEDAVTAALDGSSEKATGYVNGDRADLTPEINDVAHEYACSWTGADDTAASAWVFAPPVTREFARTLVKDVPSGCESVKAPDFGTPSNALRCDNGDVMFRGLFGDAWLTCQVSAPDAAPDELLERTERWCVTVTKAAGF